MSPDITTMNTLTELKEVECLSHHNTAVPLIMLATVLQVTSRSPLMSR